MKKFSLLLVALGTLPFSTSHGINDTQKQELALAIGGLALIGGGYYYYTNCYNKTPHNNTDNPTGITPLQVAITYPNQNTLLDLAKQYPQNLTILDLAKEHDTHQQPSNPTNKTQADAPKLTDVTTSTQKSTPTITQPVDTERSAATIATEILNALNGSIKNMKFDMDYDQLLKENLDILEG